MLEVNKKIFIAGELATEALAEIEYTLLSLKNIARYYYDNAEDPSEVDAVAYAVETTRFIDENGVTQKLSKVRSIISEGFDGRVGEDDMDDLERAFQHLPIWKKPGD
jgi:hypothetical protein